jgi:uncharacterized iron-regulated protein
VKFRSLPIPIVDDLVTILTLCRIDGNTLRLYTSHWAPERWQEYEPLLNYCRDNRIKLVACGTPREVIHN